MWWVFSTLVVCDWTAIMLSHSILACLCRLCGSGNPIWLLVQCILLHDSQLWLCNPLYEHQSNVVHPPFLCIWLQSRLLLMWCMFFLWHGSIIQGWFCFGSIQPWLIVPVTILGLLCLPVISHTFLCVFHNICIHLLLLTCVIFTLVWFPWVCLISWGACICISSSGCSDRSLLSLALQILLLLWRSHYSTISWLMSCQQLVCQLFRVINPVASCCELCAFLFFFIWFHIAAKTSMRHVLCSVFG